MWLPDVRRLARVVADLIRPSEFHPITWVVETETVHSTTYEWNHAVRDAVSAVIEAGLALEYLHEHNYTLFPRWPFLKKSGFDAYRLPEGAPRLPLMYSLRARKPDEAGPS